MEIRLIKPYPKNAKKHPKKQVQQIANSIKEFGFNQPIVIDGKNEIIVGHGRYEAAKILGLQDVPVIQVNLTEEQAKAYRLADNKLNESEWDMNLVIEELKGLNVEMLNLSGFDGSVFLEDGQIYTSKIEIPVYTPRNECPPIESLFDRGKTEELQKEIEESEIPSDVKMFLKYASERHTKFRYDRIADFYSHADEQTKRLMEKSALVIIDYEKAIENGFVELCDELEENFEKEYGKE